MSRRGLVNIEAWPVHLQQHIDSMIREHGLEWSHGGEERFEHITVDLVNLALSGFRLDLAPGRTVEWLAGALRKVFALPTPLNVAVADRAQGNAVTRERLLAAAPHLEKAAAALAGLSDLDLDPVKAGMRGTPLGVFPFDQLGDDLRYVASCFQITGRHLKVDAGPWRAAAARELSTRRAYYLAPLFTAAFDREATENDYPGADRGPWADFYQRMVITVTGENIADVRKVLKEARRRHLAQKHAPLTYPDDWLA